ncbi:MarR family winged helix-turn-helix transcriptional regulator [Symbiobacterium thermophilum]|uniref:Transcriptional regulator n=1 Tax=Symbiobacterium thermophilum TaxID=2734 RepID=A0A1Y2T5U3_SYMTR|nr:MarR family transcriptional regulator [Symbiobacterium thermophilum]MBY6276645.1 transcriptional regulator [Symbiobacterium thermophilum]OTA41872.1 MAG: transcriptional regulator [Symbiobacterium thermophilum]
MLVKPSVSSQVAEIDSLLREVGGLLRKWGRDILGGFDITNPQFEALLVLREHGELTMGELCAKMFLACSTATDLIDRMERNQLIERVRDTADRRVIRLRVLPKGNQLIDQILEARQAYLSNAMAGMAASDKARLIWSLQQLTAVLSREA